MEIILLVLEYDKYLIGSLLTPSKFPILVKLLGDEGFSEKMISIFKSSNYSLLDILMEQSREVYDILFWKYLLLNIP